MAQERGYLDARCGGSERLTQAYGLWCWRLRIPMVWIERQTPRSKFGCVRVEMFTSVHRLTDLGQSEIREFMGDASEISAHNGKLTGLAAAVLEDVARKVYRAATRLGNSEPNRTKIRTIGGRNQGLFQTVRKALRAASA